MRIMKKLVKISSFVAVMTVLICSAQAKQLQEINVSYVKSPFNLQIMVMKDQKLLEKEFGKDGIKINWHEITSGAKQAQAMAAGSLDIGSVMNTTSVLLANAAGNPVKIVNGVSRPSETFAIVAGKNGPMTIEELRGKKVAGPKGTVLHQMLVAALESKGMREDDVEFISMGLPMARTAMLSGRVDASLLAGSLVIKSLEAGAHVISTADGLVTPKLVSAASGDFVDKYPEIIQRYQKVFGTALRFIEDDREGAIRIGIKEHGISFQDGKTLSNWAGFTDHLINSDIESMREDVLFLKKNNMLKNDIAPETVCLPTSFKR